MGQREGGGLGCQGLVIGLDTVSVWCGGDTGESRLWWRAVLALGRLVICTGCRGGVSLRRWGAG